MVTVSRLCCRLLAIVALSSILAAGPVPASGAGCFWRPTSDQSAMPAAAPQPTLGRLAYVQGGDIWYRDLPDGDPHRLTASGENERPRWSPSGRWLAFRSTERVLLKDIDWPQDRFLPLNGGLPVGECVWAPTDDRLAFVSADGGLWVINAARFQSDNSDPPVLNVRPAPVGRIAWSPDGEWLAYDVLQVLQQRGEEPPDRYSGVWRVRPDGTEAAEVYTTGSPAEDGVLISGWSQDSSRVLCRPDPLFSASLLADGVPLIAVPVSGGQPVEVSGPALLHPDFLAPAPTGSLLAVAAGEGREAWRDKFIQVTDLASGQRSRLTDESVAAVSPSWSPDGSQIAFVSAPNLPDTAGGDDARVGIAKRRVWVMNSDGTRKHTLTVDPAYRDERPLWSADGTSILFGRIDTEGRFTLWLVASRGGHPRLIVDDLDGSQDWFGYYGHIAWDLQFDWWRPAMRDVQSSATSSTC